MTHCRTAAEEAMNVTVKKLGLERGGDIFSDLSGHVETRVLTKLGKVWEWKEGG